VGKIAEKAFSRSVFLTIWHCIFSAELTSAELTKNTLLQTVFLAILLNGIKWITQKVTQCMKKQKGVMQAKYS